MNSLNLQPEKMNINIKNDILENNKTIDESRQGEPTIMKSANKFAKKDQILVDKSNRSIYIKI